MSAELPTMSRSLVDNSFDGAADAANGWVITRDFLTQGSVTPARDISLPRDARDLEGQAQTKLHLAH